MAQINEVAQPSKPRQPWLETPSVPWRIRDVGFVLLMTVLVPVILVICTGLLRHIGLPAPMQNALHNEQIMGDVIDFATLVTEVSLVVWILKKYHTNLKALGVQKFSVWRFALWVLGALVFLIVSITIIFTLVAWLVPSFNANQSQDVAFEYGRSGAGLWLSFVSAVVIAPIVEEIYFRGLILPVLMRRFGVVIGIFGTSLLFALLHFQPNVVLYTFVLAIILAIVRLRLKSVIPSMLLHAINNFIAFSIIAGWIH
jgi:membrane protease YdiL (CAAX protease family)